MNSYTYLKIFDFDEYKPKHKMELRYGISLLFFLNFSKTK